MNFRLKVKDPWGHIRRLFCGVVCHSTDCVENKKESAHHKLDAFPTWHGFCKPSNTNTELKLAANFCNIDVIQLLSSSIIDSCSEQPFSILNKMIQVGNTKNKIQR